MSFKFLDWRTLQNNKKNVVKFSVKSESLDHALKKLEVCYFLKKLGFDFYTEAFLKNKGRADIFVVGSNVVIEILCSEDEKRFDKKLKSYGVPVYGIKVSDELSEDWLLKVLS